MHEPVALVVLGLVLLTVALLAAMLLLRRRALARRVGSFICVWSPPDMPVAGVPGISQYATGRLVWWKVVSLSFTPAKVWSRDELTLLSREELGEVDPWGRPIVRARCLHREDTFCLTMSENAYSGLVSWLEARPRRARAH